MTLNYSDFWSIFNLYSAVDNLTFFYEEILIIRILRAMKREAKMQTELHEIILAASFYFKTSGIPVIDNFK